MKRIYFLITVLFVLSFCDHLSAQTTISTEDWSTNTLGPTYLGWGVISKSNPSNVDAIVALESSSSKVCTYAYVWVYGIDEDGEWHFLGQNEVYGNSFVNYEFTYNSLTYKSLVMEWYAQYSDDTYDLVTSVVSL